MDLTVVQSNARIMAVTKDISVNRILPVLTEYHITLIGENRWQEAKEKLPQIPSNIEKHFIGHLQTNKVKEVVAAFDAIESIDSEKLLCDVAQEAKRQHKHLPIFLQVNISGDPKKFGYAANKLADAIRTARTFPSIELVGLVTITAQQSPEETRRDFRQMKILQTQFNLRELSMGMSDDWKIAIEEGATIIRLGRALFGER